MGDIGRCRHGEFKLLEGCPKCIEEARTEREALAAVGRSEPEPSHPLLGPQIVKVRYFSETTGELSAREYTYFSEDILKVGDIVIVPVRDTIGKAKVSAVDVPEAEIAAFKDKGKTIPAGSRVVGIAGNDAKKDEAVQIIDDDKPIGLRSGPEEPEIKMATIPEAKPDDERKEIKPLGELIGLVVESKGNEADIVTGVIIDAGQQELNSELFGTGTEAVVRIDPGKDQAVVKLLDEIMRIKEWADKLVVGNEDQAKAVTNDLSIMSKLKKAVEEKRQEYVGPLNAHVKAVNDAFKFLTGPLAEADKTARDKVTGYKLEQERRRREAEEINRQAIELARKQAELNQGVFTVDVIPVVVPETPRLTRTEMGTSGLVENWTFEVVDFVALPNEYKVADAAMLTAIAKKYHDTKLVPGVRFVNKPTLRVSSK